MNFRLDPRVFFSFFLFFFFFFFLFVFVGLRCRPLEVPSPLAARVVRWKCPASFEPRRLSPRCCCLLAAAVRSLLSAERETGP